MVRAMMQLRPRAALRVAGVPTNGKTRTKVCVHRQAAARPLRRSGSPKTSAAQAAKLPRKPKRRVIMDASEDDHARAKELLQQQHHGAVPVDHPCMSVQLTKLVTDVWTAIGDAAHALQTDDVYEATCSRELRPVLPHLVDWLRSMHDFLDCAHNVQTRGVAALHVWELVFAADHARHQHKFAMCHVFESAAITRRKMHIVAGEPCPKHQRVLSVFP
jgi:hypothetical protein